MPFTAEEYTNYLQQNQASTISLLCSLATNACDDAIRKNMKLDLPKELIPVEFLIPNDKVDRFNTTLCLQVVERLKKAYVGWMFILPGFSLSAQAGEVVAKMTFEMKVGPVKPPAPLASRWARAQQAAAARRIYSH